jgi:uncharacterized protein YidB (DUF937 family)
MPLFNRDFRLTLGEEPTTDGKVRIQQARVISGTAPALRLAFRVQKSLANKALNTAEVTIYNLATEHRALLQKKGSPCTLEAGYAGALSQLFTGQVDIAGHTKEGTDWVTKFHTVDGAQAVQTARVNESMGPGTTVAQAGQTLVTALGLDAGNALSKLSGALPRPGMGTFQTGVSLSGRPYDLLGSLAKSCGFDLSVQDGAVQLLGDDEVNGDDAVILDPEHGLIGNVEQGEDKNKKPTVLAKSLLQPRLKPGTMIYLKSRNATGFFRVATVTHAGDTWGADWSSDLSLETVPPPPGGIFPRFQKLEALP